MILKAQRKRLFEMVIKLSIDGWNFIELEILC